MSPHSGLSVPVDGFPFVEHSWNIAGDGHHEESLWRSFHTCRGGNNMIESMSGETWFDLWYYGVVLFFDTCWAVNMKLLVARRRRTHAGKKNRFQILRQLQCLCFYMQTTQPNTCHQTLQCAWFNLELPGDDRVHGIRPGTQGCSARKRRRNSSTTGKNVILFVDNDLPKIRVLSIAQASPWGVEIGSVRFKFKTAPRWQARKTKRDLTCILAYSFFVFFSPGDRPLRGRGS